MSPLSVWCLPAWPGCYLRRDVKRPMSCRWVSLWISTPFCLFQLDFIPIAVLWDCVWNIILTFSFISSGNSLPSQYSSISFLFCLSHTKHNSLEVRGGKKCLENRAATILICNFVNCCVSATNLIKFKDVSNRFQQAAFCHEKPKKEFKMSGGLSHQPLRLRHGETKTSGDSGAPSCHSPSQVFGKARKTAEREVAKRWKLLGEGYVFAVDLQKGLELVRSCLCTCYLNVC